MVRLADAFVRDDVPLAPDDARPRDDAARFEGDFPPEEAAPFDDAVRREEALAPEEALPLEDVLALDDERFVELEELFGLEDERFADDFDLFDASWSRAASARVATAPPRLPAALTALRAVLPRDFAASATFAPESFAELFA